MGNYQLRKAALLVSMMIFSNVFSKPTHNEEWASYFSLVNDAHSSIFVDLGLKQLAPVKKFGTVLWVWLYFQNPRPDGLSSREESETLYKIEDALIARIINEYDAIFAGRITTQGRREFYFYSKKSVNFEASVEDVMNQFQKYVFETGIHQDQLWEHYLGLLFPSPEQHQLILDYRVLEHLEKEGDSLEEERPVQHWSYFRSTGERQSFVDEIEQGGFTIIKEHFTDNNELPHRYGVSYKRVDAVSYKDISKLTLPLFRLCNEHNGIYDGWETEVVKK